MAVARRYSDSLHTIVTEWSIDDVITANEVLDALDDAADRAEKEATRGRR